MRDLWPPLHEIAHRVRIASEGLTLVENPVSEISEAAEFDVTPPMPAFLSKLVERSTAVQRQTEELREGMVVLYVPEKDGKPNLTPFALCLDHMLSRQGKVEKWTGWMASPDVDYAGPYDVILEPADEPFDPHAGMIQTWNPLALSLSAPMRLLAELSAERLALVREVEKQHASAGADAGPPRPGHVELRPVGSTSLLTGTTLGGSSDPRTRYQVIYRALAQEFEPRAANDERWFGAHRKQWYAMAATVVAGIGAVLIYGNIESEKDPSLTVASQQPPAVVVAPADIRPVPSENQPADHAEQVKGTPSPVNATPQPKPKQPVQAVTQLADASIRQPMPILLASLDEARYAIPVVRSANTSVTAQPDPEQPVAPPTHVLRIADRKSVGTAIELLAKLGIAATPANSPVPAVMFALPAGIPVAELEEKLLGNEIFLPRSIWLKQ